MLVLIIVLNNEADRISAIEVFDESLISYMRSTKFMINSEYVLP